MAAWERGSVLLSTSAPVISWIGFRVVDVYGARLGRAEAYVTDPAEPDRGDWILVRCGRFSNRTHRLAPFTDAIVSRNEIWLPTEQSRFEGSPVIEPGPGGCDPGSLAEAASYYLNPGKSPLAPSVAGGGLARSRPNRA